MTGSNAAQGSRAACIVTLLIAALAALALCACSASGSGSSSGSASGFHIPAFFKTYTMSRVDIDATVDENGRLSVTETRTFDFDGPFTCVWWEFDSFGDDAYMTVDAVSLEKDGETRELKPTDFKGQWRDEGGPGYECYSLDMKRTSTLDLTKTAAARARWEADPSYTSFQKHTKSVPSTRGIYVFSDWPTSGPR